MQASNVQMTEDKTAAILIPILGLFLGIIPSLIIYLIKKSDSTSFTVRCTRENLNFHISYIIYFFGSFILSFIFIGVFVAMILGLCFFVFSVIAAVKASKGICYQYPFIIRLIG